MFIGIDVAKKKFDICLLNDDAKPVFGEFENNQTGFKSLHAWLKKHTTTPTIIIESTGVYSLHLSYFLHEKGYLVSIADPKAVHKFAQALSLKAKTDKRDAQTIAQFGKVISAKPWSPPPESMLKLRELLNAKEQLELDLQSYKNRKEHCLIKSNLKLLTSIEKSLEKELAKIDAEIEQLIEEDDDMKAAQELLESIPGIAEKTARILLSEIGDLKRFESGRELASYAGVVPSVRESGSSVRGRGSITRAGSRRLRNALYFPAMAAMRFNPILKEFADRLRASGKPGKMIITAVMRKLLHIVYGVLKHRQAFNPNYLQEFALNT